MCVHVVYAHPSPNSFTAAVHRHIVEGLAARGHQVDDLDLYAEHFQPVLNARGTRGTLCGRCHSRRRGEICGTLERSRSARSVLSNLVVRDAGHPQRMFRSNLAARCHLHSPPEGGPIRRGLTSIGKLVVATKYNAPRWLMLLYSRTQVEKP